MDFATYIKKMPQSPIHTIIAAGMKMRTFVSSRLDRLHGSMAEVTNWPSGTKHCVLVSPKGGRMGFLRLASAIVAVAFLVGCTRTHPKSDATPSRSDLIEAYRRAHDHGDMQAMMKLFCWDRVTPEVRTQTEDVERGTFALKIFELKVTTEYPVERMKVLSYVRDGATYRFNLPVVAALAIYFPPLSKDNESVQYYALGIKDGRYLIALMAPMKQHTQNAPASESVGPIPVRTTPAARRQEKLSQ